MTNAFFARYVGFFLLLFSNTAPSLYSADSLVHLKKKINLYQGLNKKEVKVENKKALLNIAQSRRGKKNIALVEKERVVIKDNNAVKADNSKVSQIYYKYTPINTNLQNGSSIYAVENIDNIILTTPTDLTKQILVLYAKDYTHQELDIQLAYGNDSGDGDSNRLLELSQDEHVYIKLNSVDKLFLQQKEFSKKLISGQQFCIEKGYRNIIIKTSIGKRVDYLVQLDQLPQENDSEKKARDLFSELIENSKGLFKSYFLKNKQDQENFLNQYILTYQSRDKRFALFDHKNLFKELRRHPYELTLKLLTKQEAKNNDLSTVKGFADLDKFEYHIFFHLFHHGRLHSSKVFLAFDLAENCTAENWNSYTKKLGERLANNQAWLKEANLTQDQIKKIHFFPFQDQKKTSFFSPIAFGKNQNSQQAIQKVMQRVEGNKLTGRLGYAYFICSFQNQENKVAYATYLWDKCPLDEITAEDKNEIKFRIAREIKQQGGNPKQVVINNDVFDTKDNNHGYYNITTSLTEEQQHAIAPEYMITFQYGDNKETRVATTPSLDRFNDLVVKVNDKEVTTSGIFTIDKDKYCAQAYLPYLDYTKETTVSYSYDKNELMFYSDKSRQPTSPIMINNIKDKEYEEIIKELKNKKNPIPIILYTKLENQNGKFSGKLILLDLKTNLIKVKKGGLPIYYREGFIVKPYITDDNQTLISIQQGDSDYKESFREMVRKMKDYKKIKDTNQLYLFYTITQQKKKGEFLHNILIDLDRRGYAVITSKEEFKEALARRDIYKERLKIQIITQEQYELLPDGFPRRALQGKPCFMDYDITLHKADGNEELIKLKCAEYLQTSRTLFSYVKDNETLADAQFYHKDAEGKITSLGDGYDTLAFEVRLKDKETLHYGKLYQCKVRYNNTDYTIQVEDGKKTPKQALATLLNQPTSKLSNIFHKIKRKGSEVYYELVTLTLEELEESGYIKPNGTSTFYATQRLTITYQNTTHIKTKVIDNLATIQSLKDICTQFDPLQENYITHIKINGRDITYSSTVWENPVSALAQKADTTLDINRAMHLEVTTAKKRVPLDIVSELDETKDVDTTRPNRDWIPFIIVFTTSTILMSIGFFYKDKLKVKLQALKKKQSKRKKQKRVTIKERNVQHQKSPNIKNF